MESCWSCRPCQPCDFYRCGSPALISVCQEVSWQVPRQVCARTLARVEHSSQGKPLYGILSVGQILGEKAAHSMLLPEQNAEVHL